MEFIRHSINNFKKKNINEWIENYISRLGKLKLLGFWEEEQGKNQIIGEMYILSPIIIFVNILGSDSITCIDKRGWKYCKQVKYKGIHLCDINKIRNKYFYTRLTQKGYKIIMRRYIEQLL